MKRRPASDLPIVLVPHPHVRTDATVLAGSPYVAGSKVPVRRLWGFYRSGTPVDTLLKRYPQLGPGKVFDALAFAFDNQEVMEADLAREARLLDKAEREPRKDAKPARQMDLPFSAGKPR
ncbi:MAG TPA: DUF433 domain-containing protein [Polyangiaceae bacterium]|nr:DUF433 domain-containing protein [Polyangiaceae bacterium]